MEAARQTGLLVGKGGMYGNVLRISPPMNICRDDVDQFIFMLDKSLAACGAVMAGASQ
jgi:4-aminobutyrate aminotransferase-like enzyme